MKIFKILNLRNIIYSGLSKKLRSVKNARYTSLNITNGSFRLIGFYTIYTKPITIVYQSSYVRFDKIIFVFFIMFKNPTL